MKTAGTSVEIYFEDAALPLDTDILRGRAIDEIESLSGVVGLRGLTRPGAKWYNHMSARDIRRNVGVNVWADYFKFCVIRNPFDKVVSAWWFKMKEDERAFFALEDFSIVRANFGDWVKRNIDGFFDRSVYVIDGQVVMDDFIRYETLLADLKRICERVGVEYNPQNLGSYKTGFRVRKEQFESYYDAETSEIVRNVFGFELEYFGYDLCV
ncbi:hypothetical protein H4S14_002487 [Agrobacterium vitis]|nr:hypothetical protein [Agrobacterium vitis]MBE1438731.1 hypothetical protein [Agrobacterium vitis]